MKPTLETFEDRTLPSVSSTAQMVEQMAPVMAMVQQELNNAVQIITQDIAQVEAMFVQEVDHILGIPTTQNATPASGAGGNSSSSSGATTTHTIPNQQLTSSTTKTGSGSGSSAPTTQAPVSTQGSTKIHPLTSDSGSGTGSGSASQSSSATVSGKVWLDNNGDNSLDSTEMGYYGATVKLINVSTGGFQSTTTDANGNYNFTFAPGGTYEWQIQVVFPYACFAAIQSSQSQIDQNGYSQEFTLGPGGSQTIWGGIQSLNVTTTGPDDPNGPVQQNQITLRDAIETGNNGAGQDPNRNPLTITFINPQTLQPVTGTINLQAVLPDLITSYDIIGPGSSLLFVNASFVPAPLHRIYTVRAGARKISGQTLEGGTASGDNGGGIYNAATLTLSDIEVYDNQARAKLGTGGDGGGIYNAAGATLTMDQTHIYLNSADGYGGGIDNLGTFTSTNSQIYVNSAKNGGGVANLQFGHTTKLQKKHTSL